MNSNDIEPQPYPPDSIIFDHNVSPIVIACTMTGVCDSEYFDACGKELYNLGETCFRTVLSTLRDIMAEAHGSQRASRVLSLLLSCTYMTRFGNGADGTVPSPAKPSEGDPLL